MYSSKFGFCFEIFENAWWILERCSLGGSLINEKSEKILQLIKNTSDEFLSKDPILFKPKTNNALLNYSHYLDPFFICCACMFALNYELILLLLITLKTLMTFFFFS